MKPIVIAAALSALAAGPAQALNQCLMPDGRKVFSDQPCDSPSIRPSHEKPLPAERLPGLSVGDAVQMREVEAESRRRYAGAQVMKTSRLGEPPPQAPQLPQLPQRTGRSAAGR